MMIQNDDTNDDTNDMIEEWLLQNTDFDIEMCESICSVNLNKYILSETQTQNITLSQQEETEYINRFFAFQLQETYWKADLLQTVKKTLLS